MHPRCESHEALLHGLRYLVLDLVVYRFRSRSDQRVVQVLPSSFGSKNDQFRMLVRMLENSLMAEDLNNRVMSDSALPR